MSFIRIHCENCGGYWEVYGHDDFNRDTARICPHCFSEVDSQTWEKQVIPSFNGVADANRELYKDSTGYKAPLFWFDVVGDRLIDDEDSTSHDDDLLSYQDKEMLIAFIKSLTSQY